MFTLHYDRDSSIIHKIYPECDIMSYKTLFLEFYEEFKKSPLYAQMQDTVEASHWHREANVAVHTDMVIEQYLLLIDGDWTFDHYKGAFACAFHDVGKPTAEETKESDTRGTYRSYAGHEPVSARSFEDYIVSNWSLFQNKFLFEKDTIYQIGWMIQMHLPYKLGNDKLEDVAYTVINILPTNPEVFEYVLTADQFGRISDTHEENKAGMKNWLDTKYYIQLNKALEGKNTEWQRSWAKSLEIGVNSDQTTNVVWVLVGPTSSGKSTIRNRLMATMVNTQVYSYDDMRYERYDDDISQQMNEKDRYDYIHRRYREDETLFKAEGLKRFQQMLDNKVSIIIDNMNISSKSRRRYVTLANQKGYKVVYVLLPCSVEQVLSRNRSRGDRGMSDQYITDKIYYNAVYPSMNKYGNTVIISDGNLIETP